MKTNYLGFSGGAETMHTCKNLIPMVVTRAMANSSKNHALLAIFHFCQNGTFEPVHEIQIFFCQKYSFEAQ